MYTENLPKYDIECNKLLKHLLLPLPSYKYTEEDPLCFYLYTLLTAFKKKKMVKSQLQCYPCYLRGRQYHVYVT